MILVLFFDKFNDINDLNRQIKPIQYKIGNQIQTKIGFFNRDIRNRNNFEKNKTQENKTNPPSFSKGKNT